MPKALPWAPTFPGFLPCNAWRGIESPRSEVPLGTSLRRSQTEGPAPPDFHSKSVGEVVSRPDPESAAGSCSTPRARGRDRQRGPIPRLVDSRHVDHYSLTTRAEHGLHIAVPKSRGDACVAPAGPEAFPRGRDKGDQRRSPRYPRFIPLRQTARDTCRSCESRIPRTAGRKGC